jgi:ribosome-binding factor A
MATRRQEKVARIVKEAVSNAVAHHLNDPRISGFVSVTRVEMTTDLRNANVYISVFGSDEAGQNKAFIAITHAKSRIQSILASQIQSKFCPVLHFYKDEKFKKTLEILNLIDQASQRFKDKNSDGEDDELVSE